MFNKNKNQDKNPSGNKLSRDKPAANDKKNAGNASRDKKDNKQQKADMRSEGGKN
jgi:hypothetical protein